VGTGPRREGTMRRMKTVRGEGGDDGRR